MIPTPTLERDYAAPTASGDMLSPSQVSNIMDCSYRWYAKKVLRVPEHPTANQSLGRAVHTALATNFDQKCETKKDLPIIGVLAVFREAWTVLTKGMEFRDEEDADELGKSGEALVAKYMEEAAPKIEPAAVEMRVEGVIAGVKVTGYIDLLDVNGCVIDIKTAKAKPTKISPMQRFQLATYSVLTPLAGGTGRIDTLIKTKTTQLVQQSWSISGQELRAIETVYPRAQALMRSGVHLPNRHSMLCSRRQCAFWRHCEQTWGGEVPEI